jgi:excinuclease ABC subunit B
MIYKLVTKFTSTGDQPEAIENLITGIKQETKYQVLLGATGTGKTFSLANVITNFNKPVLVLANNKTLAMQLYGELRSFFPHNRVEYFVSYFDFYRPEAYLPKNDVFINKTAKINNDIKLFRLSAFNSLLSRKDVIVVASVAAIYGAHNPEEYQKMSFSFSINEKITFKQVILQLEAIGYQKYNGFQLRSGFFAITDDVIRICPG